jgi:hypothetical protein
MFRLCNVWSSGRNQTEYDPASAQAIQILLFLLVLIPALLIPMTAEQRCSKLLAISLPFFTTVPFNPLTTSVWDLKCRCGYSDYTRFERTVIRTSETSINRIWCWISRITVVSYYCKRILIVDESLQTFLHN